MDTKLIFNPDSELVDFATYFSDNYKDLEVGSYTSDVDNYEIKFLDRITDLHTGCYINTNARVCVGNEDENLFNRNGIIELDKTKLSVSQITQDYVFFIILWCVCKSNNSTASCFNIDELVVNYYIITGRSKKNLALGIIELFRHSPSLINIERYKKINKLLLDAQNKKLVK